MMVAYYKVNHVPVGVRIWFWENCGYTFFFQVKYGKNGQRLPKNV